MKTTKTIRHALIVLMGLFCCSSFAQGIPNEHTIWFDKPNGLEGIRQWDGPIDDSWESRSFPIGNSNFGGNILGSIAAERITLNEKSLWRGGPNTEKGADYYWKVNKNAAKYLPEIREALVNGDVKKATEMTEEHFTGWAEYYDVEKPYRFGTFITMGELYIETGLSEVGMTDYCRALDIDSALVSVSFKKDGIAYKRTYFTSYPDSVMVVRFTSSMPRGQHLVVSYQPNPHAVGQMVPTGESELGFIGHLDDNQMKFALRIKAIAKNGTAKATADGKLVIADCDDVTLLLTADTDYFMNFDPDFNDPKTYVGPEPAKTTLDMLNNASNYTYNELFERHYKDYAALYNRVKLTLRPEEVQTKKEMAKIPTYKRLQQYRKGQADFGLEELYYQFGRYLVIASSRAGSMPSNLQGLWANQLDPAWHADYHNNINIQMNYWPVCSTNLMECYQPLIDYIKTLVKPGEVTAKAYYDARGWTTSISTNIFGFTAPLTAKALNWNLCPIVGPWLATHVWDYYDYTRDKEFLKTTGYDLIKSSAQFTVDYLWKRPDGTYTATPSTSPEHGPISQGATFVHAVAREILMDAIDASKVLNVDAKERKQWQEVLDNIYPYQIGSYGQLMEWYEDLDDPKDTHRHVNHLFGLHPGHQYSPSTDPKLTEAAKVVLNHRGDGATGWSMGWKLNQWARLHDGNRAYKLYGNLLKNGTLDNLWDTHTPFQIDGNFGGTAGVTEMIMQSHMGFIQLLPALPDAWSQGCVSGLRAKGNFTVDMEWENGKLKQVIITSNGGEPCTLKYGEYSVSFKTQKGKTYTFTFDNGLKRI